MKKERHIIICVVLLVFITIGAFFAWHYVIKPSQVYEFSLEDYTYYLDNRIDWSAGKHYIYNVTINPQQIKFAPTVQEWGQGNSTTEGGVTTHGQTVTIQ